MRGAEQQSRQTRNRSNTNAVSRRAVGNVFSPLLSSVGNVLPVAANPLEEVILLENELENEDGIQEMSDEELSYRIEQ